MTGLAGPVLQGPRTLRVHCVWMSRAQSHAFMDLVSTLAARAASESMPWTVAAECSYALASPSGEVVVITSKDQDDVAPFTLELFAPSGALVELLVSRWEGDEPEYATPAPWNDNLESIYQNARTAALGIDSVINGFVSFINSFDAERF